MSLCPDTTLPLVQRNNTQPQRVDENEKKKNFKTVKRNFQLNPTPANKTISNQSALNLANQYKSNFNDFIDQLAEGIREVYYSTNEAKLFQEAWDIVNRLTNKKSFKSGLIPAEDENDCISRWYEHFKNLLSSTIQSIKSNLNLPKTFNNLTFKTGPFSFDELEEAKKSFAYDKAHGYDDIDSTILRLDNLSFIILQLLNFFYTNKDSPIEWLVEIESTKDGKGILTFIDFSKAFDSIKWDCIEAILISYDVPQELVDRVMMLYYNAQARVKVEGNLSDPFKLGISVLQGDTLAPFLFIVVIDWSSATPFPSANSISSVSSSPRPLAPSQDLSLTGITCIEKYIVVLPIYPLRVLHA